MLLVFLLLIVVVSGKPLSEGEPQVGFVVSVYADLSFDVSTLQICEDKSTDCDTQMDVCHDPMWERAMRRYCAKTCGFCRAEVTTTTTTMTAPPTTSKPHQKPQQQQQQQSLIILFFQPERCHRLFEQVCRWIVTYGQFPNLIRIPYYNTAQLQRSEASDSDRESNSIPVLGPENDRIFTRPNDSSPTKESD